MNPELLQLRWVDQISADPMRTTNFYKDLMGFGERPVPEPNACTSYCLTDADGEEVFGIVDETNFKNWASGWVLYFEVEDYETQCAKIEELGGQIIAKSQRQCLFKDPSGAPAVISPATDSGERTD